MFGKTTVIALGMMFVLTGFTGCLDHEKEDETPKEKLIIAYEVKEDYENPDENPQIMADYLSNELNMDVELYAVTSEGRLPLPRGSERCPAGPGNGLSRVLRRIQQPGSSPL